MNSGTLRVYFIFLYIFALAYGKQQHPLWHNSFLADPYGLIFSKGDITCLHKEN